MAGRLRLAGLLTLMGWTGLFTGACMAAGTDVIATAPSSPQESAATSGQVAPGAQISAWGRESDDGSVELGPGDLPDRLSPRTIHGQVTAGIGSSGYREVSGVADLPIGQTGDLVVAGSRSSFSSHGFGGGRQSVSVGLFLNGSRPQACDRNPEGGDLLDGLSHPASMHQGADATWVGCSVAQQRSEAPRD